MRHCHQLGSVVESDLCHQWIGGHPLRREAVIVVELVKLRTTRDEQLCSGARV